MDMVGQDVQDDFYSVGAHKGVSLVELMVVLSIIAVLLALLLPAVQSARERARETVCMNNVYQINMSILHFAEAYRHLPQKSEAGQIGGWMVEVLPFMEQQNYQQLVPIGSLLASAPEAIHKPPKLFRCPARTTRDDSSSGSIWPGHYVLAPFKERKAFWISDAPIDLNATWLSGPEVQPEIIRNSKGPHGGGFYFARGFQEGVGLMRNGEEIR